MRSDTATGAGSIISPERALILGMEMVCEDLPAYGVILVPPDSPEYDVLLADIERRVASPVPVGPPLPERARPRIDPEDRATSAILVNRARAGIASIYQIWTFQEP